VSLWITVNRVPPIRFFLFRIWRPITSFLISNIEAIWYLRKRAASKEDLEEIRSHLVFVDDLAFWYSTRRFEWHPDPANGWVDFVSKPWVSVAKNYGDCDDMAAIAMHVLTGKVSEINRVSVYSTEGRGHAVVTAKEDGKWLLVTNQYVRRGFDSSNEAASYFYADKTGFIYTYGVGATFPEAA
jgi:hypothetical protein